MDIYGSLRKGNNEFVPFLYQGQYVDAETGLAYNRFRYYDNEAGNYISQDPIRLASGEDNLYMYVHDVNGWIDVLGLSRRGNSATRAQNAAVRDQFLRDNPGSRHVGGSTDRITGDKISETYLPPNTQLASTRKGSSFVDLTFDMPDGTKVYVQTVDKGSMHGMSLREWDNANRIMRQDPNAIIITVRKGHALNPGDLDVKANYMQKGSIHTH